MPPYGLNNKQYRTLKAVLTGPISANLVWADIENLFQALGANVSEGRGSRVRVELNGVRAVFHRPHPQKEANKGRVRAAREFLETAGVQL